jgi:hypothetical protein
LAAQSSNDYTAAALKVPAVPSAGTVAVEMDDNKNVTISALAALANA